MPDWDSLLRQGVISADAYQKQTGNAPPESILNGPPVQIGTPILQRPAPTQADYQKTDRDIVERQRTQDTIDETEMRKALASELLKHPTHILQRLLWQIKGPQ